MWGFVGGYDGCRELFRGWEGYRGREGCSWFVGVVRVLGVCRGLRGL